MVTVNGLTVADAVLDRRDSGRGRFVPVAEAAEAFATEKVREPKAWKADLLEAEGIFGPDDPADPFDRRGH